MARLKVFVFDPLGAGAAPGRCWPQSFRRQGAMVLQALLADLGALPGVDVVTADGPAIPTDVPAVPPTAAHGGAGPASPAASGDPSDHARADPAAPSAGAPAGHGSAERGPAARGPDAREPDAREPDAHGPAGAPANGGPPGPPDARRFGAQFAAGLQAADAVWPLAIESDGVLEQMSRSVLRAKRILLGSAPGAVEVAASKLKLAHVLAAGGVAAVATYSPHAPLPQDGGPWVVKPDDGAGCLDTRLFNDRAAALAWIRASATDGFVLQPFVAGKLGSLSLICCDGVARVLACNQERVAMRDNRFHFLGSVVNGLADDDGALARLAQQVAAAIPSLWGYVGVDFVLTARGAVVLDVNPRLTAAYAGLHASIGCNPAGLVLDLLRGPGALPALAQMRRAVSVDVGAP